MRIYVKLLISTLAGEVDLGVSAISISWKICLFLLNIYLERDQHEFEVTVKFITVSISRFTLLERRNTWPI